jgi:Prp8 binding protein
MEPPRKRAAIENESLIIAPSTSAPNAAESSSSSPPPHTLVLEKGHTAAINRVSYSPSGSTLASASKDCSIGLWRAHGDYSQYMLMRAAHKGGITAVSWVSDAALVTSSADGTLCLWDAESGTRVRRFVGHSGIVNDVAAATVGSGSFISVSDDGMALMWDTRSRNHTHEFQQSGSRPLLAAAVSNSANNVFIAGVGASISAFDARRDTGVPVFELSGHTDTVLSVALAPDGTHLISFGLDNALRAWDVRPFALDSAHSRSSRMFLGSVNNFELNKIGCAFSCDGLTVAAGSSDGAARVWNFDTAALVGVLPGHAGACVSVAFADDGRIATSGTDRRIYVGKYEA